MRRVFLFTIPAFVWITGLLSLVTGMECFTGNARADQSPAPLRIFNWQAPTIFNPHLSSAHKDWEACRITYEPLATPDADGKLVPILAAEIPNRENGGLAGDDRSVIWKLKPGVTWSDGHPFTAEDVVFTWTFVTDPRLKTRTRYTFEDVKEVVAVDPHTVRILFRSSSPAWEVPFVGSEGMILPRHMFSPYKPEQIDETAESIAAVGTGPYRMTERRVKDTLLIGEDVISMVTIHYEANPRFREPGKPFFPGILLHGGGGATMTARAVLVEGTADFAWNLQVDERVLEKMTVTGDKGTVQFLPVSLVERIMLNFSDPNRTAGTGERSSINFPHPFLSDKRVRQAFAHAVDRKKIAALYGSSGIPATNILVAPPGYNSPNTAGLYPFDPDRARGLLDQAGWQDTDGDGIREKDGVPLQVLFQTSVNRIRQQTQQIIREALASIGVGVELKIIDASVFFDSDPSNPNNMIHFYADLQEMSIGNRLPDPAAYMSLWLCDEVSQQANGWSGGNYSRWCHPAYDRLFGRLAVTSAPGARRDIFIRLNDLLIREVAAIPLVNRKMPVGISRSLDGVRFTPWDRSTWNIKDWRRRR